MGDGKEADTGGTTRVISLDFAFGFWGTAFCFGSDVEGAAKSVKAFFPVACFLGFTLDVFLTISLVD